MLFAFIAISVLLPRPAEIVPSRVTFSEFPPRLGPWMGQRSSLEGIYIDALKLDDYLLANYVDEGASGVNASPINLYVSYYNSQRKGEAVHSPRSCLPGGGWQLREFGQRNVPGVRINGQELRVNRTLIELGNQRQLVYYWFQQRGRVVTNEFAVKWYLFWDALRLHRTDGALVRIIAALPPGSDESEADRKLADFAARIAPELQRFIPN
jgi:EpsI family protein